MEKITIIVPIYNVEKYLRKCFDSLLSQDFNDYLILAINDGSLDNSDKIMQEYAIKYPERFKAVYKENGGYGSVLQLAISMITSKYFLICDPDDYLEKDALSHLYELAEFSNADLTIGAKYFIYEDSDDKDYDYAYNTNFVSLKVNTVYNHNSSMYDDILFVDPSPHSKLYKTAIARNITFLEKVGYTDNMLFYLSYLNAKKIIYTDKACAYYLVNRKGNTMTDVRPKAISAHVAVFKAILEQSKASLCNDMFYYRMFESYKFIIEQVKRVDGELIEVSEAIDFIYTLVEKLIPYRDKIMVNYKKYSKARILERIRDNLLLTKKYSLKTFRHIKKKLLERYKG